jgi:hypothetical protein
MVKAYVVTDINGDNYGPFSNMDKAEEFIQFLICGDDAQGCDIVPVTMPQTEWEVDLFE